MPLYGTAILFNWDANSLDVHATARCAKAPGGPPRNRPTCILRSLQF